MKDIIYLDYNATTPTLPEVIEEFKLYSGEYFANPSSAHKFGKFVKEKLEGFRKKVADLINAEPEEIIFTSGGTEANHLALFGIALSKEKGHILVSSFEHPSVLKPAVKLLELGFQIDFIPINPQGYVDPDEVKRHLKSNTILVSVMMANNEIGTIQPIKEIAEICKEREIYFHTDACQAVGKIVVDVKEIGCSLLSMAGHKMYAPKGIGALFVKKGVKIEPIFLGGGQERGLRAGTEPIPLIAALAKACEIIKRDLTGEKERLIFLREKLYQGLKEIYPGLYRYGIPEKTLPNTLTVSFIGKNGAKILSDLSQICASTGAACHDRKGSHTLLALKVSPEITEGTVRFSLGRYTSLDEIEKTLEIFSEYFKGNV
ncbi:MAG: cysteine desulfurase NifS [Thermodesulfobacterium geofontis]|uniref:cysteine desulfurase n=1 Tax=Thermodesulfobacterium geofontis TaxID=1295609 RepID=A0A2N7PMI5_9BACT|nr:MAG: cysteine desulfurase NifS [Thermodesulfobacterium geofontis]PMP97969.1 MAG: cysteine desulfurase NifS [Thermodesulfobacterium geofontis]